MSEKAVMCRKGGECSRPQNKLKARVRGVRNRLMCGKNHSKLCGRMASEGQIILEPAG